VKRPRFAPYLLIINYTELLYSFYLCARNESDCHCEDPFADVTLIPESTDSEVFAEPSFVNYFQRPLNRTAQSCSGQWGSDGLSVSPTSSMSQTSESFQDNAEFRLVESNLPHSYADRSLLRRRRHLLGLNSSHSGRSRSVIFAALGGGTPERKMEEPQLHQVGNRTRVGSVETETLSVADKNSSEGIRRCGVAASTESDAHSGWSTVLRNCEKNIPLSSFVPYSQRMSMLPDHVASHPLDLLTDPGRKTPNCRVDCSESSKAQEFPDSEDSDRPSKPLVQLRISSDCETVKSGSRTSSETNLQSFHERINIADIMPPGFENAKDPQSKEIHGLMSTHFLPKRPLSQICSRTINASNIWKMGSAPAEGLPHCHAPNSACGAAAGNPWKSACNISAQIQAARSCSQRSFNPLPSNGADRHERLPFSRPSDLSSAGSSALASSSASVSTVSQATSSLETSPTHNPLSAAVNSTLIENGVRSRLSSFDRDCK